MSAFVRYAALVLLACGGLWAGDISGKWKAEYTSPDGVKRETVFLFTVDSGVVKGTVESKPGGVSRIADGKLTGDELMFTIVNEQSGEEYRVRFKGKVVGDKIRLRLEWNEGEGGFEMTAQRVPS